MKNSVRKALGKLLRLARFARECEETAAALYWTGTVAVPLVVLQLHGIHLTAHHWVQ